MKAMIFAAGFGKRMRPLSSILPKPLMPLFGVPLIERTICHLKRHGISQFVVNLHHFGHLVEQKLGDGARLGVQISYSCEKEILGTAGGLRQALGLLGDGTFLALNGDVVMDLDVAELHDFHKQKKSSATLALWTGDDGGRREEVAFDAEGKIVQFLKAKGGPAHGELTSAIFTGAQILEPEILTRVPPGLYSSTTDGFYQGLLLDGVPFYGYHHKRYWADIGTPNSYRQAHIDILSAPEGENFAPLGGGGGLLIERDVTDDDGAQIFAPCFIGENCRLSKGSKLGTHTVLGKNCIIEAGAFVAKSVLLDNIEIGRKSRVDKCIIASGVKIGPGAELRGQVIV